MTGVQTCALPISEGEGKRSPLADLPNVVLTPHIGAQTIDAQEEIGREIVAIIDRFDPSTAEVAMSVAHRGPEQT